MIEIGQNFTLDNGVFPTKASLFLRKTGISTPYFTIVENVPFTIDASNVYEIDTYVNKVWFENSEPGFTGAGYISIDLVGYQSNKIKLKYPIKSAYNGKVYVYIRLNAISLDNPLEFTISLDEKQSKTSVPVFVSGWNWVESDFVIFDKETHNFELTIDQNHLLIDKIIFSTYPLVLVGNGNDYSTSPYFTLWTRINKTLNGLPDTYIKSLSFLTSDKITKEDWYNFDLTPYDYLDYDSTDYSIIASASGQSASRYLIWDYAKDYSTTSLENDNFTGWVLDATKSMSLRIYKTHDTIDEYLCNNIITPEATLVDYTVDNFNNNDLLYKKLNTEFAENNEDVQLDMGEKVISVLIDQSGSNTWKDINRSRFGIINKVLDDLESQYPSDLNFNLLQFKGEKTFSFIIPLNEEPESNSVSDIVKKFFEGNPNNFAGFRLIRKIGSYPENAIDGEIVFDGYALAALDSNLEIDTNYYYTLYTFDHKKRFSNGKQLNVTTGYPFTPRGIPYFKIKVLTGWGDISSDSNTLAMWNNDEGENNYVYDFSNSLHLTLSNIEWTGAFDIPVGKNALRFNGYSSRAYSSVEDELGLNLSGILSIFGWIYPFELRSNTILCYRGNSTNINYAVVLDNDTLKFTIDGTNWYSCDTLISEGEWTHIGVGYNNGVVSFWINGVLAITTDPITLPSSTVSSATMNFNIGYDSLFSPISDNNFFGKISHFSLHNTIRDSTYISTLSNISLNNSLDTSNDTDLIDNGDRVVVFDWIIPDDANYSSYKIVRNKLRYPTFEGDGDLIFSDNAIEGRYTFGASYPYDVNEKYWFRVFTLNSYGNWSPIEDSSPMEIFIPDQKREPIIIDEQEVEPGPGFGSTSSPTNVVLQSGNEKVFLKWDEPTDDATRVKIYYSDTKYPTYDSKLRIILGDLIWDGPKEVTSFVHRDLTNQKTAYYVLVTTDRLGRFSQLVYKKGFPLEELDDSGIPLLEAEEFTYSIIDYSTVELNWKSPVKIAGNDKSGWLDDRFSIYAAICDLYGNPIPIDFPEKFALTSSVITSDINSVEDVFDGNKTLEAERLPNINFHIDGSGLIFGTIRINNDPALALLNSIQINFGAKYNISSDFTYSMDGINITFKNPVQIELVNRDNLFFNTEDLIDGGCETETESGGIKNNKTRINAVYIRRKKPFAIRAFITYKGEPIDASFKSKLFDGLNSPCSISAINTSRISTKVLFSNSAFNVQTVITPILGADGEDTGYTKTVTFADILFYPPQLPQSAICYVKGTVKGFASIKKMNVFFPTILKIKLSANAPKANNIDVREQFATSYLIDPDNPEDTTKFTYPPTNTIAKWELEATGKDKLNVPFYSTDNVPLSDGIYSYFRSGNARNIFFGPANVSAAGGYKLTVSTTVRGLFAETSKDLEISSTSGGGVTLPQPDVTLPRILAEFENGINYIWADGQDYQKLTITRNPSTSTNSTTKYADKFRECSDVLYGLPIGTQITIEAPGYQIITGDVSETTTNGEPSLNTENAIINLDRAKISLTKDPYTYVYFRTEQFIKNSLGCYPVETGNCVCFDLANEVCYKPYSNGASKEVKVYAKINYLGKPQNIFGGGDATEGYPPTILVPIEPLYLKYLGLLINDIPSPQIIADNETINYFYWDIRFKDQALLDAPVYIKFLSNPTEINGVSVQRILDVPDVVYAEQYDELPGGGGNPDNREYYSIIKIPVGPIPKDTNIKFAVLIDLKYPIGE